MSEAATPQHAQSTGAEFIFLNRQGFVKFRALHINGKTFLTLAAEPTLKLEQFTVPSKSLLLKPDKLHGFSARETRNRRRLLDLMENPKKSS